MLACEHLLYILRLPSCRLSSRNAFLTSSAASERSQIQIFRPCFCPFDRSRNLIRKLRCAAVLHTSIFRPTRHPSTRHPSCRSVTLFSAPAPDGAIAVPPAPSAQSPPRLCPAVGLCQPHHLIAFRLSAGAIAAPQAQLLHRRRDRCPARAIAAPTTRTMHRRRDRCPAIAAPPARRRSPPSRRAGDRCPAGAAVACPAGAVTPQTPPRRSQRDHPAFTSPPLHAQQPRQPPRPAPHAPSRSASAASPHRSLVCLSTLPLLSWASPWQHPASAREGEGMGRGE